MRTHNLHDASNYLTQNDPAYEANDDPAYKTGHVLYTGKIELQERFVQMLTPRLHRRRTMPVCNSVGYSGRRSVHTYCIYWQHGETPRPDDRRTYDERRLMDVAAHTITQRLRTLKRIPPELIPLGMRLYSISYGEIFRLIEIEQELSLPSLLELLSTHLAGNWLSTRRCALTVRTEVPNSRMVGVEEKQVRAGFA